MAEIATTAPLLQVDKVRKEFGGLLANDDVSFTVSSGEIVGLIGPNGAGKTTLFNCIAGYFLPTRGEIWFNRERITALPPEKRARAGVGRTFQIARTFSSMTALENVMVGSMLHDRNLSQAKSHADELLQFVGLAGHAHRPAGKLTISEQRRLAVARALAIRPKLLLMDEVMAGLNPTEVREAVSLVLKIRQLGIALLIVEHVLEGIMPIADKIIVMDYGKKIAEGPPAQVAKNPQVIAAYLGDEG